MMKIKLMQTIYASNLKSRAILVMNYLIFRANKEGTCFPAIKTIAKECHISVNTVKRALDDLIKAGYVQKNARFIEEKNGAQTSNLYTLSAGMFVYDDIDAETGAAIDAAPVSCLDEPIEQVSFESMAAAVLKGEKEEADQPVQDKHGRVIPNSCISVHIGKKNLPEHVDFVSYKWAAPQPTLIPP
ncbi:helix-turn-helix domain-containing protein [Dehalobacterium formicoaceticum]|uniref:helix-turn-helix domain-containing protein n=1 Tax=Dehalobacterium formicoaceticum TaxID=51515 RepID=UPI0031F63D6F